ncbi:MAG: hypothetical protein D6699_07130 [Aquificota bacterium]|nr:MAG: hypothetical protein D6699_07130 [Aquificota bacterium]
MIERVELQRIINEVLEREKRKEKVSEDKGGESAKVELSRVAKSRVSVDYEEIDKKVEAIRQKLEKGQYEVSPEKIVQGIEKYLSSK